MTTKKKLIEVALPLDAINKESALRKRKAPAGYPTSLHNWWAQRPIAAARAVIFAQMVDDPSAHPDLFPTEKAQEKERQRLFRIIEELVLWENTNNEEVLQRARDAIWQSWRYACADRADDSRANELYDRYTLPAFRDPFAGSGALPLEAQRLGLTTYSSDLNPVAVLMSKAIIEVPPKFAGQAPVNAPSRNKTMLLKRDWRGAQGLAEDVQYYGRWMVQEAERRIGHLYPKAKITSDMAKDRPELQPYIGESRTVIAWLWARTVKSPNPAFGHVEVPLVSTFMLTTKPGKEVYVEPVIEDDDYRFMVRTGKPKDSEKAKHGTKLSGSNFTCLMSGTPISGEYIKSEGKAGRLGVRLIAVVASGARGRIFLNPSPELELAATLAHPTWKPEGEIATRMTGGNCTPYGLTSWGDLFTPRQLVALTTFSDLIQDVRTVVASDARAAGLTDDGISLADGGHGVDAYSDAIATYLAIAISRLADYGSSIATWRAKDNAMRSSLPKQAIQMTWDFAEGSPFGESSSGFAKCVDVVAKVISTSTSTMPGQVWQGSATSLREDDRSAWVISTDPPYYDNISYADLSDFYYVWLRRSLRSVFPDVFTTVAVPKADELVATTYRHGSKAAADSFFLGGMTKAMKILAGHAHPAFPITIYYAFKQSESDDEIGTVSTGWDSFLGAVIAAGLRITGTWPMRTEGDNRQIGVGANALASSIVLVCRPSASNARPATRRDFVTALKAELAEALVHLQRGNIAPVDLAQAAIGPGMAVYTRYSDVLDASGNRLSVRDALAIISQILDESLEEQEGDFDPETRWAIAWFNDHGFNDGPFSGAHSYFLRYNTAENALKNAGIIVSGRGRVRLLKPSELPVDWNPITDSRLTAWEMVHHLVRVLESSGEAAAASIAVLLGSNAATARELAYRLYTISERKKRSLEALSYNGLVQSWPEITRLARENAAPSIAQGALFDSPEE